MILHKVEYCLYAITCGKRTKKTIFDMTAVGTIPFIPRINEKVEISEMFFRVDDVVYRIPKNSVDQHIIEVYISEVK